MFAAADLLTDADLLADLPALTLEFGDAAWDLLISARRSAVVDWLAPRVEAFGYVPVRHRTRQQPTAAYGYTGSAYTDLTTALGDEDETGVALASIFATPVTDALYVGHRQPFTGLFARLDGAVNANSSVLSVAAWTATGWDAVTGLSDGTIASTGKSFSGGGRVSWTAVDDWAVRAVNGTTAYWVKLTASAALSGGAVSQLLPIVRSRFALPASLMTASLIHRSGSAGRRGAWLEQAKDEEDRAEKALATVLPLAADEFDQDGDDAVGADEATEVKAARDGVAWTLERG